MIFGFSSDGCGVDCTGAFGLGLVRGLKMIFGRSGFGCGCG
jgi:hypothetical protein